MTRLTLYLVPRSHPVQAVRKMLEFKGLEPAEVSLVPGIHGIVLRLRGFATTTVPALVIDGEKVQGSTRISMRLEELVPEPTLFGSDPSERRAIQAAERWADVELQPIHRRALRYALLRRADLRPTLAPRALQRFPRLAGVATFPQAALLAWLARASPARVRAELATLPAKLDHVDALIARGTIGNPQPTAADFQIGSIIWSLLAFEDFRPYVKSRPCASLAGLMGPERPPVAPIVPPEWLP